MYADYLPYIDIVMINHSALSIIQLLPTCNLACLTSRTCLALRCIVGHSSCQAARFPEAAAAAAAAAAATAARLVCAARSSCVVVVDAHLQHCL